MVIYGVRDFLRFNWDFLEEIIIQEVPQETLERILIRKAALKSSFEDADGSYRHMSTNVNSTSYPIIRCRSTLVHIHVN